MPILPLHKRPLPNPELAYIFEKYIKPEIWEGELWLDNGWGDKNSIQELMENNDPITGFRVPFLVQPVNDIEPYSNRELNKRYSITFPGEQYGLLLNFIEAVKEIGVKEQKFVLNSYFSTKIPPEGARIYQLIIEVKDGETTFSIEQGKWIPSFEDNQLIARW
jgi:hypothetical protein